MAELRLVELSAATIVAVNNMSLKPGQEQFLAPVSYGIAATVADPRTAHSGSSTDSCNKGSLKFKDFFRDVIF